MAERKKKTAAKVAGTMSVGVALAVVITQILDASGVHLGQEIVGPLGVVLGSVIHEARNHFGGEQL